VKRLAPLLILHLLACSHPKDAPRGDASPIPVQPPASSQPSSVATLSTSSQPMHPVLPKYHVTLRSTPGGALVTVDGHAVGSTPAISDVEADGKLHDFAFTLPGYEPWKVKFSPIKDGVVHATMKQIVTADAGSD
jgi:hypothetical protein